MTFNRVVVNNHPGMHGTPLIDGSKLLSHEAASWHVSGGSANGLVAVWHEGVQGWSVFLYECDDAPRSGIYMDRESRINREYE